MKKLTLLLTSFLISLSITGCSNTQNADDDKSDPIYVGQPSVISQTNPTESSNGWSLIGHGIGEGIYKLDEEGNLVSRFIKELKQIDDNNWEATMHEDVLFADGDKVTAKALSDCMNEITEKNPVSKSTLGTIKFEQTGDYTLTINTEKVTKTLESVLAEWTRVVFKIDDNGEYVFTGPYMIKELNPGVELKLYPNPNYTDADKRSEVIVKAFLDTSAMKLAFESGEIDMAFNLPTDVANMIESEGHQVNNFNAGYQYFTFLNLDSEVIEDIKVRQALNKILDREEMLKALKGGKVANGIFAQYYSFAGDSEVKTDVEEAKKLLQEAGYKPNSEGILEKDGEILELRLVTYASRPDLPILMQIAASQLDKVGIKTTTSVVDDVTSSLNSGEYDMMFYAQFSAPYGEPLFFLKQVFSREGENYTNYDSDEFEEILEQMTELESGDERDKLAIKAQEILFKDLPVLYLIDPEWKIAVSDRLKNYVPYSGDYYIINEKLGIE